MYMCACIQYMYSTDHAELIFERRVRAILLEKPMCETRARVLERSSTRTRAPLERSTTRTRQNVER